uniref:asparagine--tRNA ligase n=1 Tax=Chlamydomonas leiostraca TaxID=1034604 RepID=A0A7S0RKV4_9CHLO
MASNGDLAAEVEALRKQVAALETNIKQKEAQLNTVWPYSRSYGRTSIKTVLGADDGGKSMIGKSLRVGGWVKTGREAGAGAFAFLEVNDGSCFESIQVMVTKEVAEAVGGLRKIVPSGTSVLVEGELAATPEGTKQAVELKATSIAHIGECDAGTYPMAKKKTSYEFLREKMHLRPRTNTIGAVARIRNALAFATHSFFQQNGFLYVHTPIITASDCEGAGEMFQVTTLMSKAEQAAGAAPAVSEAELASLRARASEQGEKVKAAKAAAAADKGNAELAAASKAAIDSLMKIKDELAKAEEAARVVGGLRRTPEGKIDYKDDFFGRPAFLTVSGQLQGEFYACALSNIYTFGPTFRAEMSYTGRHLAEFWMIEPEIAFCDLKDDMQCAEDYVRFCCKFLLDNCRQDLEFVAKMIDSSAIERLEQVAHTPFKRVTYTEAIELLEKAVAGGKKFEYPVSWGIDLATEHERFLTEDIFKQPVIVYNYPKDIKAFYMKLNEDGKTVAAMDVLVPKVGELIGGSQREDRYDVLKQRIEAQGMDIAPYEPYLDIRKYGSVPHSGFGLGFERLILFATGLENIREVIPFPRWPGNAQC